MPKFRLTGVSAGAAGITGGIQWDIVASDHDIVVNVIDELEDRRLLWESLYREHADRCAASASYMRAFIGTQLRSPGISKPLKAELKTMRRNFSTFMSNLTDAGLDVPGLVDPVALGRVVGWLRSAVGEQVGLLAAQYNLDVSDDLAVIVPNQNDWFFREQGA